MPEPQVRLYYKNVMARRSENEPGLSPEHGITEEQFAALEKPATAALAHVRQDREAGNTPYRDLPSNAHYAAAAKEVAAQIEDGCEVFVVLGIGGSALGNIALQTALNPYMYNVDPAQRKDKDGKLRPQFFVFDNVDPAQFASFLRWAEDKLDRTYFNVISKSGRTAETASQLQIVWKMLDATLGPKGLKDRVIATTGEQGILRQIAKQESLTTLPVPDGVGGRFSVLSPVGLLSAEVCGIDIDSLLCGAADMDKRVGSESFLENPAAVNAAINHHFYERGKRISVMMPYSYALKDLADWHRQLWAESLGKEDGWDKDSPKVYIGPTPVKALGTTDQHSQVQLYREGPNDKLFTFLEAETFAEDLDMGRTPDYCEDLDYLSGKKLGALLANEKRATEYALLVKDRPCLTVLFPEVNAYTVGQFIYLYEVTTSITAALFHINAYDQPAVELGKVATMALMGKEGEEYDELRERIAPYEKVNSQYLV